MLVSCSECEKPISDHAVSCPNCGLPIRGQSSGGLYTFLTVGIGIYCLTLLLVAFLIADAFLGTGSWILAAAFFAGWWLTLAAMMLVRHLVAETSFFTYRKGTIERDVRAGLEQDLKRRLES